jgi:8-oxo-dGTP pyrophosphatase MutT (NUDIX family)
MLKSASNNNKKELSDNDNSLLDDEDHEVNHELNLNDQEVNEEKIDEEDIREGDSDNEYNDDDLINLDDNAFKETFESNSNFEIQFYQANVFKFLNDVVIKSFTNDSKSEKIYMNYMRELLLKGIEFCKDEELRKRGFGLSEKLKDKIYEEFEWFDCGEIKYTLQNAKSSHFSEHDVKAKLNMVLNNGSAGILLYHIKNTNNVDLEVSVFLVKNYQNKWGIPKGSREEGETFEECAAREFLEECNYDISSEYLKNCDYIYNRLDNVRYYIVNSNKLINGLPREPNNEITALGWFNFKKNIIWRNNREDTKQFMCFVNKYPFCDKSKGEYSKNKNDDSSVSQQNVKIFKKSIIDPELSQVTKFAKSFNNNKESRKLEDIVSLNSNGKVRKTFFHNSRIIQRKSWRDKYEESGNNKVKINNKTLGLLKERRMISKSSVMAFVRFSEYLSRRHDNINKGKYNYIKLKIEKNRNYFRNLSNFSINYLPK